LADQPTLEVDQPLD